MRSCGLDDRETLSGAMMIIRLMIKSSGLMGKTFLKSNHTL